MNEPRSFSSQTRPPSLSHTIFGPVWQMRSGLRWKFSWRISSWLTMARRTMSMLPLWHNLKFVTLFSVWRFLLHQHSVSRLPKLRSKQRNSPNWLPSQRVQSTSMAMKLSPQPPVTTSHNLLPVRRSGEFVPSLPLIYTWEPITFTSRQMISKRPATPTFYRRTFSKSLSSSLICVHKLPATSMESVLQIIHKWRRFGALSCHRNGALIRWYTCLRNFLHTSTSPSWSPLVGFTPSQMNCHSSHRKTSLAMRRLWRTTLLGMPIRQLSSLAPLRRAHAHWPHTSSRQVALSGGVRTLIVETIPKDICLRTMKRCKCFCLIGSSAFTWCQHRDHGTTILWVSVYGFYLWQ